MGLTEGKFVAGKNATQDLYKLMSVAATTIGQDAITNVIPDYLCGQLISRDVPVGVVWLVKRLAWKPV